MRKYRGKSMITIKNYSVQDESALFDLIKSEGSEWENYWGEEHRVQYKAALSNCIVYVAYDGDALCGYCRCRDDDGYGIYIYDLLVGKAHRGQQIGRKLMMQLRADHPNALIYVMSDVDEYYEKQGFQREGSIFQI